MIDAFAGFVLAVFIWCAYTDQQEAMELQSQVQEMLDNLYESQRVKRDENQPTKNQES